MRPLCAPCQLVIFSGDRICWVKDRFHALDCRLTSIHRRSSGHPRKWLVLLAVGLCLFLGSVDGSIVNVALPTLMKDFGADFATIQWVVLSYLLGLTILMVGMGRLADIIGKKRVFTTGTVLFLAASALCGLALSVYWLIAFRALQSVGAAMMLGLGVAILTETWPSHERGKAIGFSAGFISLGIVLGPTIGGFMLEYLSWHWIFYVNLPMGALSLLLSILYLPRHACDRTARTVRLPGRRDPGRRAALLHPGHDGRAAGWLSDGAHGRSAGGRRVGAAGCSSGASAVPPIRWST